MTVRPVTGQIHVKPDPHPTMTESGFYIPDAYADDTPPMSGIVVAMGEREIDKIHRARQQGIRDCAQIVESAMQTWGHTATLKLVRDEIAGLLGSAPPDRDVQLGDRVIFPFNKGYEVVIGEHADGSTVILREADVLAVCQPEAQVA